jgi:hypothetical protein
MTGKVQVFEIPPVDINIKIKKWDNSFTTYKLALLDFNAVKSGMISCSPN